MEWQRQMEFAGTVPPVRDAVVFMAI